MPRRTPDPERIRRAAAAYLDGECERRAAAERAGCSPHSITVMATKLRLERALANIKTSMGGSER